MFKLYILLSVLWFIWIAKYLLFWLYLWQLKEYHIGRFIDHFNTNKGKKLLLDIGQFFKFIFLIVFVFDNNGLFYYLLPVLILVYLGEFFIVFRSILNKTIKKPVETLKSLFLTIILFFAVVLYSIWTLNYVGAFQIILLISFDILVPIIVSIVVLFFQPFFVIIRGNILKKADKKIKKIRDFENYPNKLKVIAITGSYGKTSTKEFLATILSEKFKVLSTSEHQNSEIGIANCILQDLKPDCQIFIAEVGAYNKGKVKEVCSILNPQIGIVTGVNEQHLALFGSLKNLLLAEGGGELAESLYKRSSKDSQGVLFVNGDNKHCLNLYKRTGKLQRKIYSLSSKVINSNIWAEDIEIGKDFISFVAVMKKTTFTKGSGEAREMAFFKINVLGKQNVQNLLGAILVAKELGMTFDEISEACKNISQKFSGMVLKQEKHGINIIDSSYSSNPDGVLADLDYLKVFEGKKVIIMPCLIELGKKSVEIHEKIGNKIGEVCDLAIITSKDRFEDLKRGAIEAGMKERNILCIPDGGQAKAKDIYSMIMLFCKAGDTVLLEGRVSTELIKLL